MTKCDGKTEQGKRQFLPPVIADTAMQIEHIVTTSLGASSQIDFILCSNNPILKFYRVSQKKQSRRFKGHFRLLNGRKSKKARKQTPPKI